MKLRTYYLMPLVVLLFSSRVSAEVNFTSHPKLPFPPSCVQEMDALVDRGTVVAEGQIELYDSNLKEHIPFHSTIFRVPCSESGRSLILFELILDEAFVDLDVEVELPLVLARPKGKEGSYGMKLVAEPNSWAAWGLFERNSTYLVSKPRGLEEPLGVTPPDRRWRFVLVNFTSLYYFDPSSVEWWGMSPTEYNGTFRLSFGQPYFEPLELEVPATSSLFGQSTAPLPLSGRHSGTWVIDGAKNQGFQVSISEQVGKRTDSEPGIPERPLLIFLSQFTFDANSQPLWLVGNAEFPQGATEVTIPMYRVNGGRFRGDRTAQRELAGQVTLSSQSCNDVVFSYDYDTTGLGVGSRRLVRAFSLETAGYECRDYEARVAANR